jgi:hypothetical protein
MSCAVFVPHSQYSARALFDMNAYLRSQTEAAQVDMYCIHVALGMSTYPTTVQLAEEMWNFKRCECLDRVSRPVAIRIIAHLLTWHMMRWECDVILLVYEYWHSVARLPTREELHAFTMRVDRFLTHTAEYSEENRVRIGTCIANYAEYGSQRGAATANCSLCFNAIDNAQKIYRLPCGHCFHATAEDCIDITIADWFAENVRCPMCRRDIRESGKP